MPITLSCGCGKKLRVKDELAGRKVKCPGCAAVIAVVAPEACGHCGEPVAAGEKACAACGTPVGHVAGKKASDRVLSTGPKEWEKPVPAPLVILGMFYKPHKILEYINHYLSQPATLLACIGFYVGSLVVVGVLSWKGYLIGGRPARRPEDKKEDKFESKPGYSAFSPRDYQSDETAITHEGRYFGCERRVYPDPPVEKKPARVAIILRDTSNMQAYLDGFKGTLRYAGPEGGAKGPTTDIVFTRVPNEDFFMYEWSPETSGVYEVMIVTATDVVGKPIEIPVEVHVRAHRPGDEPDTRPADVVAIEGAKAVLVSIVASLVIVLFQAALLNLAARMFGEGGEFVLMLVVLTLAEGVVNVASVGLLFVVPSLGWDWLPIVNWVFTIWTLVLLMIVVMKVYDLPAPVAMAVIALAAGFRTYVVSALIVSAVKAMGWGAIPA